MCEKSSHCHVFIDESGSIHTLDDPPLLVGGLLVLGDYRDEDDDLLNGQIARISDGLGGCGIQDIHDRHSPTFLGPRGLDLLRSELARHVGEAFGEDRPARGVALAHGADIFEQGPWIIAEDVLDNRYIQMLWALLEHVLFVDPWVGARLAEDARVHLHVANRMLQYGDTDLNRDYLASIGQDFTTGLDAWGRQVLRVPSSIREADLRATFRMALREKWPCRRYELASVEVSRIQYAAHENPSRAGLYIADLHLGAVRAEMRGHACSLPVVELLRLEYNPTLLRVAAFKSRMEQGLADASAGLASEIVGAIADQPGLRTAIDHLQPDLRRALEQGQDQLESMLDRACLMVDEPGRAAGGLLLGQAAWDLLSPGRRRAARNGLGWLRVRLSHANHTADRAAAEQLWAEYIAMEPATAGLGIAGISLRAGLWTRRAVSLLDQFRLREAESALSSQVQVLESARDIIARACGSGPAGVPLPELGAAYGTLGQVLAIQGPGRHGAAEAFFRRARGCFPGEGDSRRQLVYLGHLACDRGEAGRALWDEVAGELVELASPRPCLGPDGLFVLALQAKGLHVFGDAVRVGQFTTAMAAADLPAILGPGAMSAHPMGLVWQGMALCAQSLFEADPQRNRSHLELALRWHGQAASFALGREKPLFRLMGHLSELRRAMLASGAGLGDGQGPSVRVSTDAVLRAARELGVEVPGRDNPDGPGDPRELLGLLRFYYW